MKIHLVGAEVFYGDGRTGGRAGGRTDRLTDIHDEANSRF